MDFAKRLKELDELIFEQLTELQTDWYDANGIPWSTDSEADAADEIFHASSDGAKVLIWRHDFGKHITKAELAWAYLKQKPETS